MRTDDRKRQVLLGVAGAAVLALVIALGWPVAASAHGGFGHLGGGAGDEALATALGITTAELTEARQKAAAAALDQAVEDGRLSQEQADQLESRPGFGLRFAGRSADMEALLAKELGITTEALRAARDKAVEAQLSEAVAAGRITQEQADALRARQALRSYLEQQGVQERMRAVYEQAVKDAVAAGVITQEQADEILSAPWLGRHGFGGFRGGFGGRFGGRFDARPFGPGGQTTPVQPSSTNL